MEATVITVVIFIVVLLYEANKNKINPDSEPDKYDDNDY